MTIALTAPSHPSYREALKEVERRLVVPGKLDRADLVSTLSAFGVGLPARLVDMALEEADRDGLGLVELREAMQLLRGPLPAARRRAIDATFDALDADGSGVVAVEQLRQRFDGGDHPLCSLGGYSQQVLCIVLRPDDC